MTKHEFLAIAYWKQEYLLEANYASDFLNQEIIINVLFNQFDTDRELSESSIDSLNDFINLDKSNIQWIKQELWRNCEFSLQTTSSVMNLVSKKEGQSDFEANKEFFGIYDSEDAFRQAIAKSVTISNDTDIAPNTCFWLEYEVPWNYEHRLVFVFVNGQKYRTE